MSEYTVLYDTNIKRSINNIRNKFDPSLYNLRYITDKIFSYNENDFKLDYIKSSKVYMCKEKMGKINKCEDYNNTIKNLCNDMNIHMIPKINIEVEDKLIIGLGNANVLERAITLHHIYGIPLIPGQAIKGAIRSCFEEEVMENVEFNIGLDKYELYNYLFGQEYVHKSNDNSENQKANLYCFDSFPISFILDTDVMTNHYNDYYNKNDSFVKPPDGTSMPIPIKFFVLENSENIKTEFELYIGFRKKYDNEKNLQIEKLLKEIIKITFSQRGIGAKKTVGYGYFKVKSI